MPTYRCQINGRTASIQTWDAAQPLIFALRHLGLTGAKPGCGLGQCGACTILIDRQPTRSCMVSTESVSGRAITTIEGLGTPEKPDPVQAAFIAEQAAQCGYCTAGMIVSTKALLMTVPRPTVEQIEQALAGNLCRCGAYPAILRAVLRASGQRAG